MSVFKKLISELAELSGLPLEIDNKNSCSLESDSLIITLQYRKANNDIVIFAPVTDPDRYSNINESVLRKALELSFNGTGTEGNYLGLFNNDLILSSVINLRELTAEKLAECIFAFKQNASFVRESLASAYEEFPQEEDTERPLENLSLSV
ncbi:type III secretion system chaperone [Succinivibrio dextrinosolvens]|uniref:type III secretion system chaperone n=1 Tax=Succinivibrio dextrinosolvens TaxID=83771 RepID=UPI001922A0FB|nr:type III secretion system chaperone [Succinivibrio dextrinosolvens]